MQNSHKHETRSIYLYISTFPKMFTSKKYIPYYLSLKAVAEGIRTGIQLLIRIVQHKKCLSTLLYIIRANTCKHEYLNLSNIKLYF